MKVILEVLERVHKDKNLRETCVPLFLGNPGLGKTKIIEQFAKKKKVQLIEIIASQLMPHEISGIAIPDKEEKIMSYFDFDRLLNLNDGDIVLFDELLNANPMVLNALLTLLENRRMVSGRPLKNVMFIAAANPQGATILTPQIKERFIVYDVSFDKKMWAEYMYKKFNIVDPVLEQLVTLIENEKFESSRYNYFTPRSIDKALGMMLRDIPTPYSKDLNPIVNTLLTNESGADVKHKGFEWKQNEKVSWLDLAKNVNKL